MATIICPNCGESIPESSTICPNCGYHLTPTKAEKASQKSLKSKEEFHGQGHFAHLKQVAKQGWFISLAGILCFCALFVVSYQYQLHQQEARIQKELSQAIRSLRHQDQTATTQGHSNQESSKKAPQASKRPILLLHGFGGSYNSERYLSASLVQTHLAKQQLMVYVDRSSRIHLIGKYRPSVAHRVVIPIVIKNNHAGEIYYSAMLAKIMPRLNHRYHIKSYDAVGHSMGSYAWINYFETHPKQVARIKPHRVVTIAGPFNGILNRHKPDQPIFESKVGRLWDDQVGENALDKNGRPKIERAEFKHLLKYKHRLPAGLKILNIYGNLEDGTDSDGLVTTTSARSLGYLVKTSHVKVDYRESQVTGPKAQHSLLHYNNLKVNHLIKDFLLYK